VREEHLVAIPLLPAEQELKAEGDRWKVDKAPINVAQLHATASDSVDARLHLIDCGPDAHLKYGATSEGVAEGGVEVGRLQLILIGPAWQCAHALEATESQEVILHALQFDALVAKEGDDWAQPSQLLRRCVNRP
jgi:hypothetical protein